MTTEHIVRELVDELRRDRTGWQLRAELDPSSLGQLASETAELGMPRELALRVIENELDIGPLRPRSAAQETRSTVELRRLPD